MNDIAGIVQSQRIKMLWMWGGMPPMALLYLLQAAIPLIIFVVMFGPGRTFSDTPLLAHGDALHHLTIARAIIEQGWYWNIERLSWPFSLPMAMFPVGGTLDYLVFKLLALFTSDPGFLVNAFFILTFAFAAVAAFYVSRDLALDLKTAFVCGLIFAFCPYPFYRSTGHLMLVTYLIPFAIGFSVHLMCGSFAAMSRGRKAIYFISAAALGLNYIYSAFFACFFVGLALLLCLFTSSRLRSLRYAASFLSIVVVATIVANLPAAISAYYDPAAARNIYSVKSAAEAEYYGLKIRQLLITNGKIPGLAKLSNRLDNSNFPLENENRFSRLGLVASTGFLALLLFGAFQLAFPRLAGPNKLVQAIGPLSALLIGGVLFATIGGFGSIFNVLVSPEVRAYNRISPFLFFISMIGFAVILTHVMRHQSVYAKSLILILIAVVAIAEQQNFELLRNQYRNSASVSGSVKSLVVRMEQALPRGAAVYQVPYTPYPNTPKVFNMESQEHLLGYVFSHQLNWSYPAISSAAIRFNKGVFNKSTSDAVERLAIVGFAALWVNRMGYPEDGQVIMRQLRDLGLPEIDRDGKGRIAVFSLAPVAERLRATLSRQEIERRRNDILYTDTLTLGDMINFSHTGNSSLFVGKGWSGQEEEFRWTEGREAQVRLPVPTLKGRNFALRIDGMPFLYARHDRMVLTVTLNGKKASRFDFELGKPFPDMKIAVDSDVVDETGQLVIDFLIEDPASPKETGLSMDERQLGIAVRAISIL